MRKFKNLWFYTGASLLYLFLTITITLIAALFLTKPVYGFLIKTFATLNVGASDDTLLIVIDDASVEKYQAPWSNDKYTILLDYFKSYAKPKVVGFDANIKNVDFSQLRKQR